MFSGYLQAGIYKGLDGRLGLPGWRWLFIFCGIISLPGSIWGVYAILDNPYATKARWLSEENKKLYIDRMQSIDRRAPVPLSWGKIRKIVLHWPLWVITLMLM
jgi:ACS family pantothenate transporter-like MFS transporter